MQIIMMWGSKNISKKGEVGGVNYIFFHKHVSRAKKQKRQVEGNVSSALSLLDIMKRDITNRLRVWLVTSEPGAADLLTGNGEQS